MTFDDAPPAFVGTRVARPVRDLARASRFYTEVLHLRRTGGFADHEGYDGAFFALPGGGELELTSGPAGPVAGHRDEDDLLVLYLADRADLRAAVERVTAHGARAVPAANPYWDRWGRTFTDPDGYRVVLAAVDSGPAPPGRVRDS